MGFSTTTPYQRNIRPGFIGDFLSREHVLAGGAKLAKTGFVNPDAVAVTVDTATAAGATTLPVTDLLGPIPNRTLLNFESRVVTPVVVGAAGAAIDAVSVPVDALTGALPNGTVLDFGGKKFARLTAAAAVGAVTLTVAALATALVDNDAASYIAVSNRTAQLTAAAVEGDDELTVEALDEELAVGDVAYYTPEDVTERVPAGTVVGCTIAELEGHEDDGTLLGLAADADDYIWITAYDVPDLQDNNDVDLLRPGTLIYVNFLPNWSTLSSTIKSKIRARYDCSVGTPGQEVAAA